MVWFRLDDGWHNHPKVVRAGNAGAGLWARCADYSSDNLLDGFVPAVIAQQYGTAREIKRVTEAQLWLPAEGGFRIRDFLEYNPSAEQVRADRAATLERVHKFRAKRNAVTRAVRNAAPEPEPEPSSSSLSSAIQPRTRRAVVLEESMQRIAGRYAAVALAQAKAAGRKVTSDNAYMRPIAARAIADPELERLIRSYPSAPDDVIVAALNGERNSLRYFTETDHQP